ncbi:MAG: FAD-binding oxidoreductase [Acidimicrobiia bacterium]|nr:FAD-binding oxidoreductase [Acidimicrobiia bacterium]
MADVVVIGGGIAGVSAAAYLAQDMDVVLVEAESALAYHATGRSAALYYPGYGHASIHPLSYVSGGFFENPEYSDHPLLSPRGVLTLVFPGQTAMPLSESAQLIDPAAVRRIVSVVNETVEGGIWEPDPMDLDVAGLHQAYVRMLRAAGGTIRTAARVTAIERGARWRLSIDEDVVEADVVVNAAGAWADEVAAMAGLAKVGLIPKRRTAFMVAAPDGSEKWPLVHDSASSFYFKPDGSQLMCSLADETPSEPCDARPQELDVALAIDRINTATSLGIRSVRSQWAGLRTFAPDGGMVIGEDPAAEGFFWLAGQGGTGIQTAPAAGQLLAGLVRTGAAPGYLTRAGLDVEAFSAARFA